MPLLLLIACVSAPASPEPPAAARPAPQTTGATAAPPEARPAPARLVAVGDLHGDPSAAIAALRLGGLVDEAGAWIGGGDWLVQTGDITDRGPDSRGVIRLLQRLQREARAAGGEVVPLLGNHEVMNLTGDWRYVSPEDLASYGGEANRKAAFSVSGADGAWIVQQDAVAHIGGTVFAHGGVDARWAKVGVRGLNATIRAAMLGQGPPDVLGTDGPLWNRAYLLADPVSACAELGRALAELGATRMVVGHTTQDSGRIAERCGGQLWGIDTGISAHYGNHVAVLEVRGDTITPLHADKN